MPNTIQIELPAMILEAVRAKDNASKDALRFLKGQLDLLTEQPVSDATAIGKINRLLKDARDNPSQFNETEIRIFRKFLPATLTATEVLAALEEEDVVDSIRDCGKEGQAMGIAMKTISRKGKNVESDVVKSVVQQIRSAV